MLSPANADPLQTGNSGCMAWRREAPIDKAGDRGAWSPATNPTSTLRRARLRTTIGKGAEHHRLGSGRHG